MLGLKEDFYIDKVLMQEVSNVAMFVTMMFGVKSFVKSFQSLMLLLHTSMWCKYNIPVGFRKRKQMLWVRFFGLNIFKRWARSSLSYLYKSSDRIKNRWIDNNFLFVFIIFYYYFLLHYYFNEVFHYFLIFDGPVKLPI